MEDFNERFEDWLSECPIDFNQIGYQKTYEKGTLKISGDDMSKPIYVFYLPVSNADKSSF